MGGGELKSPWRKNTTIGDHEEAPMIFVEDHMESEV